MGKNRQTLPAPVENHRDHMVMTMNTCRECNNYTMRDDDGQHMPARCFIRHLEDRYDSGRREEARPPATTGFPESRGVNNLHTLENNNNNGPKDSKNKCTIADRAVTRST
jgi:hypothetical protein